MSPPNLLSIRIEPDTKLDRRDLEDNIAALAEHARANGDREIEALLYAVCAASAAREGQPKLRLMEKFLFATRQILQNLT